MHFSTFEIATMTAEEREFYLKWFVDMKKREKEAQEASSKSSNDGPKFGPAT